MVQEHEVLEGWNQDGEQPMAIIDGDKMLEQDLYVLLEDHDYTSRGDGHTQVTQQPPDENLPTLKETHHTHVATAVHVPKSARTDWARVLTAALWGVVNNSYSTQAWITLLIACCILPAR